MLDTCRNNMKEHTPRRLDICKRDMKGCIAQDVYVHKGHASCRMDMCQREMHCACRLPHAHSRRSPTAAQPAKPGSPAQSCSAHTCAQPGRVGARPLSGICHAGVCVCPGMCTLPRVNPCARTVWTSVMPLPMVPPEGFRMKVGTLDAPLSSCVMHVHTVCANTVCAKRTQALVEAWAKQGGEAAVMLAQEHAQPRGPNM